MKLKMELIAMTAASVLTMGTALAQGGPGITEGKTSVPGAAESITDDESPTATGSAPFQSAEPSTESTAQAEPDATSQSDTSSQASADGSVPVLIVPVTPVTPAAPVGGGQAEGSMQQSGQDQSAMSSSQAEPGADVSGSDSMQAQSDQSATSDADVQAQADVTHKNFQTADPRRDQQQSAMGGGQAGGSVQAQSDQATSSAADRQDVIPYKNYQTGDPGLYNNQQSATGSGQAGGSMQQYDAETVKEIQKALNDKGFQAGHVDGMIGPATKAALRNFQEAQGMQATGQPDQETLSALGVQG